MYEEEEDEFPRSFRLLAPHMQTSNDAFNNKIESFLRNKVAMSQFMNQNQQNWQHENEVNRLFAEAFPNMNNGAGQRMPSISAPVPAPPPPQSPHQGSMSSPFSQAAPPPPQQATFEMPAHYSPSPRPSFGQVNYAQPSGHHSRGPSFSAMSPAGNRPDMPSPPALTPGSQTPTPQSQSTPYFGSFAVPGPAPMDFGNTGSAFTTELPADARLLMNGGMTWDGSFDPSLNTNEWQDQRFYSCQKPDDGQGHETDYPDLTPQPMASNEEPAWDTFLDDNAFTTDGSFNPDQYPHTQK